MLNVSSCSVVFKDVQFAYPSRPGIRVLHGLNLTFDAGKTTAIIGTSGSGKSTLTMLLERFYDPSHGQIFVNGVEIQEYNIRSLRSGIRVVQQESVLFNDSVFNNVCVGLTDKQRSELSENAKRQLVEKVCKSVQAHDFIKELPRGYDANVGIQGSLLSGGQRQRIAIARAIISNPTILVFDEATSALDPTSEQLVQAAIDRVSKERTTIVIAHKLSTVKEADVIIMLENGRVLDEGTHQSLLHSSSIYRHTWEVQNLRAKDPSLEDTGTTEHIDEAAESKEAAQQSTSKNVAETEASISEIPAASFSATVKAVARSSNALKYICAICPCAAIFAAAVFPAQAVIFGHAVTSFQRSDEDMARPVNFWSLLFFLTAVTALLAFFTLDTLASIGAALVARTYRQIYLHGFLYLPVSFYDNIIHTPGYLGATLASDPSHLQAFTVILGSLTVTVLNLSSVTTLGLVISWRFAIVALFSSVPVIILAAFLRQRSQSKNSKSITESLMDSAQFASEVIRNIRTVSAFGMEDIVCETMSLKMDRSLVVFYKNIFSTMPLFAFAHSGSLLGSTISFWYSGDLFFDKKISALQIWIVFLGVVAGADAAGEFFSNADSLHKARNAWGRISEVIRRVTPPFPQTSNASTEKSFSTSITFLEVSFAYHSSPYHNVLQNLSFHIAAGSTVAVVGPSGSGKSTIISLLERFYSPTEGNIEMGGRSLSEINLESYRNHVSLVSQDIQLFEGTVRDNILFGMESGTSEQALIQAARDANIHGFIQSLPEGYNTACGKKGMAFSGGQRQRLAIARALVRNPSILLLDEATSALDSENEIEIKKAMRKVTTSRAAEGRTTVVVTHRLSAIQDADCIFVLVEGSMVEKGTHVELIERKGVYWSMCEKQDLE